MDTDKSNLENQDDELDFDIEDYDDIDIDNIDFEFNEELDKAVIEESKGEVEPLAWDEDEETPIREVIHSEDLPEEDDEPLDIEPLDSEDETPIREVINSEDFPEEDAPLDIDIDLDLDDEEETPVEEVINSTNILNENGEIVVMSKDGEAFDLQYIDIANIAIPQRIRGNVSIESLATSIESNGLLKPIVVAPTSTEGLYVLIDGLKRLRACAKCGIKKIPSIVNYKVTTAEIAILEALYNHYTEYKIKEIIDYIEFLEKEKNILDQTTIEYLLQMEPGDYPKLKDIINDNDPDIVDNLLNGKFSIDQAYKKLQKKRKEQSKEEKENQKAQGAYANEEEGVGNLESGEMGSEEPLTEEEIKELGLVPTVEELEDKSLDELLEEGDSINGFEPEVQKVGERHHIDPALRKAVMARDKDTCQCCFEGGESYVLTNDYHHILPVFLGGADSVDNAVCLCCKCHRMVHLHARGELFLPEKSTLDEKDTEKFKRIISYGNHIRKGMQAIGMKVNDYKKQDNINKIGRDMPGKLNEIG